MSRAEDPGIHPQEVWQGIESMRGEPCVIAVGDSAFTVATPRTDFGAQRLYRIDLESGEPVWFTPPFESSQSASCPAADESHVYYPHGRLLTAREISSGEIAWETELPGDPGKPVVSGGIIYLNTSTTLFAVDAGDGSVLWSAPASRTVRPPLVVAGAVVNFSFETASSLSAFDAKTGKALWSIDGRVYDAIGVNGAVVYGLDKYVASRAAGTGLPLWSFETPTLTSPRKLVAGGGTVYALAPSLDFRFQANHLIALDEETGSANYVRKFQSVTSCCGTTSSYPPFVKFGAVLYNHYRYFDAATGAAPGGENETTHSIFYDGSCGSNEQDSMFAAAGGTIVLWKQACSGGQVLVAKRAVSEPEGPGKIELIEPGPEAITNSRPRFGWAVESTGGLSHYELVVDKEVIAEVPATEPKFFFGPEEGLAEGAHTWSVVAVSDGGTRTESETRSFTIDSSPPAEFQLLEPANGAVVGSQPQFAWEAAVDVGPAGLSHYALQIDSITYEVPAGTESFSLPSELADGGHEWAISALDRLGNVRKTPFHKFTVDSSAPQGIKLISPPSGQWTDARPLFRWYAAGAGVDHYELLVGEAVLAKVPADPKAEIFSFTPEQGLADGKHSWSVRAVDGAGNFKESETSTFLVDGSPPSAFSLSNPADGAFVEPRPEFDWEAATDTGVGLSHYELLIDGEPIVANENRYSQGVDLADGAHTWSVVAIDQVGNRTASETRDFAVDGSPPEPFALLEPVNGAITDARPHFKWEAAIDVGPAGIDHYELCIDETRIKLPPGTESYVPSEDLAAGGHAWWVEAVDGAGHHRSAESQGFIVASPPHAALAEDPVLALTGVPVTLDASVSTPPPAGEITGYRWDLDGNGSFETDTGTTPTATHLYSQVKDLTVSVRVLSNLGTEAADSALVSVRPAPPAGPLGITVNNGAQFTNNPNVTVSVIWPAYAATASLSNDGGFRTAGLLSLAAAIPWTLESSGSERLPKTVYVRFQGGSAGRETYQDDIILDQGKPKVGKVALTGGTVLNLSARDRTSGVAMMQIASEGSSAGPWRLFRKQVRLGRRHRGVKVRVRDRAGNVSLWRRTAAGGRKGRSR